jgi:hypothetical protein
VAYWNAGIHSVAKPKPKTSSRIPAVGKPGVGGGAGAGGIVGAVAGQRRRASAARTPRPPVGDVALVLARDGRGTHILRRRGDGGAVEQGILQPLTEGKPIEGEIVSLQQRPEFPLLFDVKTEWTPPTGRPTSDGPAQVATEAYRRGWDAVWGDSEPDRTLN